MKKKSNVLKSIVVFSLFIVLTFYFVFRSININDITNSLSNANITFILVGVVVMLLYFICDSINIKRILISLDNKINFRQAIKYSFVGFFFSSITPSSTGGQPMQIYYMSKDNIKLSNSTITCLVNLACFQMSLISLALLSIIFKFDIFLKCALMIKIMIVLGIILNGCVLFFSISAIFSKKIITFFVHFVVKLTRFFHYKKCDKLYNDLMKQVVEYKECASYLKGHKSLFVKNIITAFIQMVLFHSIPYFIYRSFGLSGQSFMTFVCVETMLYVSTSCLPSPGAVGVSELNFMFLYKLLFPVELLSSAMVLSRGINFYLYVLISGLYIIFEYIVIKISNKNITNL